LFDSSEVNPQKVEEAQEYLAGVGISLSLRKQAASLCARKKKKKMKKKNKKEK
jgi:hypothetical protein